MTLITTESTGCNETENVKLRGVALKQGNRDRKGYKPCVNMLQRDASNSQMINSRYDAEGVQRIFINTDVTVKVNKR